MSEPGHRTDPGFLKMIGLVALTVAIVILVFFGIGYLFGRLFL
jgi:type IV secretory pathway VirB2 component (pilin)